ncbi:MAG: hypothetical protein KIT73_19710 [Burkholderiales bacterium]|nr:hypothetical protein [Burkholderiales bacterium]
METPIGYMVASQRERMALLQALALLQTALFDDAFGALAVSFNATADAVDFEMEPGSEEDIASGLGLAEVAGRIQNLIERTTPGVWSGIFWTPDGVGGRLGWTADAAQGLRSIFANARRCVEADSSRGVDRVSMLATLECVLSRL